MTSGTTLNPPADAPKPTNIPNTVCCDQTVRVGEKPAPITGSNYLNPYKNEPYGINSQWSISGGDILNVNNQTKTLELDYIAELKNITITRALGYNYGGTFPNKSNSVTIKVVPSPVLSNIITATEPINSEGFIELSSIKKLNITGYTAKINLNILEDPFHTNQRTDNIVNAEGYKWEYTKTSSALGGYKTWITIPNENLSNLDFYDPSENLNSEDVYYLIRRVAVYQNLSSVSEPIKVLIRAVRYENTICCDQILKINSLTEYEKPQIITGSTPIFESTNIPGNNFKINSIIYQWQVQNIQRTPTAWSDIAGATSKDYLPSQPLTVINNGRGSGNSFETSYNYRRIAKINYQYYHTINSKWVNEIVSSYSNQTSLTGSKNDPYLKIYPNPTSSVLNIESTSNMTDTALVISNIMGVKMNSNYSLIAPNLISIDVSNLPLGTYFISIENNSLGFNQRTFIKQ
ncbi:T9SS type A sorting domain-containing protein [Flavobacterium sp. 245]|uniref:T9SS type A sorting domain-containing protein n=1 Tax=Flavobacterium sp. 245 TaxID=2512115 RepID=UPI0010F219FE|nr:T9SS type A sorting domain-containing protein [Flavobacterium sp. 245]TDP01516.1 putative secreted protein (Por secretion system target) [Flavobacterium sp. 245]